MILKNLLNDVEITFIIVKHINDPKLFKLAFLKALNLNSTKFDNNIFNWADGWSVRCIPRIDSVKDFITGYFKKFGNRNNNFKKLEPIAKKFLIRNFHDMRYFWNKLINYTQKFKDYEYIYTNNNF